MKKISVFIALLFLFGVVGHTRAATIEDIYLVGPGGLGGTSTFGITNNTSERVGTFNANDQHMGQSFQVTTGVLSQIWVSITAVVGTPTSGITWEVRDNNNGVPGNILQSGAFTPVAFSTNVVTVTGGVYLEANTLYWLVFRATTTQPSNTYWFVAQDQNNVYTGGFAVLTLNNGVTYSLATDKDIVGKVVTSAADTSTVSYKEKLAQSFSLGMDATISEISLYLKKVGTPTGTLTARIEFDVAENPSGTLMNPAATATFSEASLNTSYGYTTFTFSEPLRLEQNVRYWIVLETTRTSVDSNYIAWGSSLVCTDGFLKSMTSLIWNPENQTGLFTVSIGEISPGEDLITLSTGQQGKIDYTITAGEGFNAFNSAILVGLGAISVGLLWLIAWRLK